MVASSSIPARFSAAAATYDRHASIQRTVADRVIELVADAPGPGRILDIGSGTGILTEKLVQLFPEASITALDISPQMVEQGRTRFPGAGNVEWTVGDIRDLPSDPPFNMVASSSSLHWVTPIDDAFRAIATVMCPGARFVFGMMLADTLAELHAARHHAAPHKAVRARLPREEDILNALASSGLHPLQHERAGLRAEFPSCSDFLQSIHEQGFTGGPVSTSGVPLTRTELKELASHYDSHYKVPTGGVFATYDCLFALAERK